jgi:hypothetical protein
MPQEPAVDILPDRSHEWSTLLAKPYHDPWPRTYCCAYACAMLVLAIAALVLLFR